MKFVLEVEMDGAAFEDNPAELQILLRKAATQVAGGGVRGKVRDTNGNTVGAWRIDEEVNA